MPTLVLSQRYTPDSNALWKAALNAGWATERLHSHRVPDWLQNEDIVLYGEGLFVAIIADQLNIALLETPLDWLPKLPEHYRQREVHLTTLEKARSIAERAFIKPAADKSFDARVYDSGTGLPSPGIFDDETPTLVSEPVQWELEYRCFASDNKVRTLAPYLQNGELLKDEDGEWKISTSESEAAAQFANQVVEDEAVSLPPAVVLDIGKIAGKGWAVIEANPAWGSGIYGNAPHEVLKVLEKSCAKIDKLPENHRQWVIDR